MNKKVGPITSNTVFGFNYRIVSNAGAATTLHTDSVWVYLSSDCGVTNDIVYLIDSTTHVISNQMKHITIPLTSYIGDDLIPSIYAKRGNTVTYNLDFDNVDFYELPVANAGPAQSLCYLDTLSLVSASATGNVSQYWTTSGDGMFLNSTLLNAQYAPGTTDISSGTVDLTLHVVGAWDTVTSVSTVTITTSAVASAGSDVTICSGDNTQLSATGGNTYVWSPTLGLSDGTIANPIASPTVTTTYTVLVTSSCGSATDNVTVTVDHIAVPNLGPNDSLCPWETVTLDAGTGYDNYLWSTGATTQTITVDTAGIGLGSFHYYVDVTHGVCAASDTVVLTFATCSGIVENNAQVSVNIFPNPSDGRTNIVVHGLSTNAVLSLYNIRGQEAYHTGIGNNSTTQFDVSNLPKGVYIIRIFNEKTNSLSKLIIQ